MRANGWNQGSEPDENPRKPEVPGVDYGIGREGYEGNLEND
jgi:hypothetical protein